MDGIRVPAVIKQAPWEPCALRGSKPSDSSMASGVQNAVNTTNGALPPHLSFSFCLPLSLAHSPLEEATLISQALMRQNGTDLVRRCATGGAEQGGWCSRGERGGGGWCMPSVTLHPPGTAVPGVEEGRGGGPVMAGSECLVGLRIWTIG